MSTDDDLASRVDELERLTTRQAEEIALLRRELRALGVQVPDRNPARPTKLSPQARVERMRRSAARARAAKLVGEGKGSVRDPTTADRLRQEAQQLADEADEEA